MSAADRDMASPENDTVMFALILLGAVTVMLAVALLQRLREIHRLRELGARVQAVADSGDLAPPGTTPWVLPTSPTRGR